MLGPKTNAGADEAASRPARPSTSRCRRTVGTSRGCACATWRTGVARAAERATPPRKSDASGARGGATWPGTTAAAIEQEDATRVRRGGQRLRRAAAGGLYSISRRRRSATASSKSRGGGARHGERRAQLLGRRLRRRQEFGHGDRILLDFVLSRHRADVRHVAEFGTAAGSRRFYLGVAAALQGATLDTFDVVDARAADVLKVPRCRRCASTRRILRAPSAQRAHAAIRAASVVLVDHVDRLEFCRDVVAPQSRAARLRTTSCPAGPAL